LTGHAAINRRAGNNNRPYNQETCFKAPRLTGSHFRNSDLYCFGSRWEVGVKRRIASSARVREGKSISRDLLRSQVEVRFPCRAWLSDSLVGTPQPPRDSLCFVLGSATCRRVNVQALATHALRCLTRPMARQNKSGSRNRRAHTSANVRPPDFSNLSGSAGDFEGELPTAQAAMYQLCEEAATELLNPRRLLLESNSVERHASFRGARREVKLSRCYRVEFACWCRPPATVRNVLVVACSLRAIATC